MLSSVVFARLVAIGAWSAGGSEVELDWAKAAGAQAKATRAAETSAALNCMDKPLPRVRATSRREWGRRMSGLAHAAPIQSGRG